MPRPRKAAAPAPSLNPGQAAYVIERLISERRVSATDVNRYVSDMQREISDLEQRLNRLREAHGGASASSSSSAAAPARRGPGRPAGSGRGPGRPAGSGRGPGRPAGSGRKGRPGRPPASANAAAAPAAASNEAAGGAKRRGRKAGRKSSALSGDQLASRQLQGRYLALVRQFPEAKRAQFAKTAKEKGREAAIKEMQDSLKK